MPTNPKVLLYLFSAVFLTLLFGSSLFYGFYNGDVFVFLPSKEMSEGLNYWLHILTHKNGFDVQYRPLGFFGYFYFMRSLFGLNPLYYRVFGLLLLFVSSIQLINILKIHIQKNWIILAGVVFYLTSSSIYYPVWDISSHGKYLVPQILLLHGLYLLYCKKDISELKLSLILSAICFLSILFHEGTLVFSLFFFCALIINQKRVATAAFCLIPAALYFCLRTISFGWPTEGFMAVGADRVLLGIFTFPTFLFNNIFLMTYKSVWQAAPFVSALIILYILFRFFKKTSLSKYDAVNVIGWIVCILPFAMLKSHKFHALIFKGKVWATVFAVLILCRVLSYIFSNESNISRRYAKVLVTMFFVLHLIGGYANSKYADGFLSEFQSHIKYLKKYFAVVERDITDSDIYEISFARLKGGGDEEQFLNYRHHFIAKALPGYLATYLPNKLFVLNVPYEKKILVGHGKYTYLLAKKNGFIIGRDIFGYTSKFKQRANSVRKKMFLDPNLIFNSNEE